jgi:hypothetical protein
VSLSVPVVFPDLSAAAVA